ncbi:MAG: hypothetical protein AAF221_08345 [Pseudomonadota bacterium]
MTRPKPSGAYGTHACPRCGTDNVLRKAKNGKIYQDCPACGHRSFWGKEDSDQHIAALEAKRAETKAPAKSTKPAPKKEVAADDRDDDIWA